jgi:signal transduction histidine kinase
MRTHQHDSRLTDILDMIGSIAALDFSKVLVTSEKNDMIDAISLGLNMLSEELNAQVVHRAELDNVNSKLERFAYTTAHDLKSPLNSQTGLLELLDFAIDDGNSEAKEYVGKLKVINDKMKSLVEGILAYSVAHFKEVAKERVDWNELLAEVMEVDDIAHHADVELMNTLPVGYFNRTSGIQLIRNLLDNAIKYSDKKRCKIVISVNTFVDRHEVSFTDNGPGIAEEHQEAIFGLFNQIEPSVKVSSVGIGLATVKGIIEAAHEQIWLTSKVGEGATFTFTVTKENR